MRFRSLLLTSTALMALGAAPGVAGPEGPVVVGGAAAVTGAGTAAVTIHQSTPRAIINWTTFNIGAGETTTFVQPGSLSVVLNRVTGGLGPSEIYGTLNANGRVFVINRDGILVGPTGVINTAGFLASTNDIKNKDFMAGRYNFSIPGRPDASIVNQGRITATTGGFAALVAPGVRNSGTITATLGTVALASGNSFTLDLYGDKLIQLSPSDSIATKVIDVATGKPLSSLVSNEGKLSANGGRVELTAAAARAVVDSVINTKGVIEANSVGTREGKIVLSAATAASKPKGSPKQTVIVSGTLSASGKDKGSKGGTVVVTGEDIQVTGAKIDVSGYSGGGKVMLGGDWAGGHPALGLVSNQSAALETYQIATATTLSVDAATTIDASAKSAGHGGKVILWSDHQTTFAGTIFARGGDDAGNGGFVELSSKGQLSFSGVVDTRAPNGAAGTLLFDPADIVIGISGTMTVAALEAALAASNVVITTGEGYGSGDITVAESVNWSSANSLTLSAYRNIAVNADLTNTGGAAVTLRADNTGTGTGTVTFGHYAQVSTAGAVSIFYNPKSYTAPTNYSGNVTGGGTLTAYMLVNTFADLQDISTNLSGTYALGRDINADNMSPIGSAAKPFTGLLEGLGHTISNAVIAPVGGENSIGLFGAIGAGGVVRNLNLSNFQVAANPKSGFDQFVGLLAGMNAGTIINVHATGTVNGIPVDCHEGPINLTGVIAGGLVGQNGMFDKYGQPLAGTIINSSANAIVSVGNGSGYNCAECASGTNVAGGLVGANVAGSTITGSQASGAVTAGTHSFVGGLVGRNVASIINSSASATIAGTGDVTLGGLVGDNSGTISHSYATGAVTGTGGSVVAGGLVGFNVGSITGSYATGNVTAIDADSPMLGGFAGGNAGTITLSHATGNVTADANLIGGGFVGVNTATISLSHATGKVTGGSHSVLGGFVGTNAGSINQTYARGAVTGGEGSFIGGFVGVNIGLSYGGYEVLPGSITQSYALGPVTGGNAVVAAGFAALNLGKLDETYAAGLVTAGLDSTTGGLVAANSAPFTFPGFGPEAALVKTNTFTLPEGTVTNSYWDRQTTGQEASAGGTALDTAALANAPLPAGFDANIWVQGSYPQLVNLGPQDTTPGPPVLPPLNQQPPAPTPLVQQLFLQINQSPPAPPPELINTQGLTQSLQQQQQQQQQAQSQQVPGGSINNPIQLNVGAGRYFFLPPPEETRLVQDEVVIQLPCDAPPQALDAALSQLQLSALGSQCLGNNLAIHRLRTGNGRSIADVIRGLADHRIIAAAQANYLYRLTQDPAALPQRPQGDTGQYVIEKLKLTDIHRRLRASSVPIAVIDSEIDAAHPDLEGAVVDRYDTTGVDEQPHSHGTGMAGAIASHRRLLGTAPGARLFAIRAFSVTAAAAESTTFNILKGLDYAVNNGVRIVNMSFAGPRDPTIERALKAAHDRGVILIAAAGNAGPRSPPLFPAADKHVIAVTATDIDDNLFTGAIRGRHIAVSAPGVDILVPAPAATYQMTTGTSVATAHVSGIVALMLERNPRLTPADVRRILTASAKRLGPNDQFGAGLIDPVKALQLAAPRSVEAPAPPTR